MVYFPHNCLLAERKMEEQRAWDGLPGIALVNIFCRTSIKDRARNVPLVCRSWAHASRHPRCWASMIAHSAQSAVDDAFVKDSPPYNVALVDTFDGRRSSDPLRGVSRLQALIQRAADGAAINSLYVFPFLSSVDSSGNDDDILRLIAHHCPNLKHLSFHGSYRASDEAILEVFRSCRSLELVDFSDSPYLNPFVLEKMGCFCATLRGIRKNGFIGPSIASALSTGFPTLKLLNLADTPILDKDLLNIVTGCTGLQYLDITRCQQLVYYMYIIKGAPARIDIHYD